MDTLEWVEMGFGWARRLGGVITLATLFYGIWQGLKRSVGRVIGRAPVLLHKPLFYGFASIAYFGPRIGCGNRFHCPSFLKLECRRSSLALWFTLAARGSICEDA